jgi:hypothetical protein
MAKHFLSQTSDHYINTIFEVNDPYEIADSLTHFQLNPTIFKRPSRIEANFSLNELVVIRNASFTLTCNPMPSPIITNNLISYHPMQHSCLHKGNRRPSLTADWAQATASKVFASDSADQHIFNTDWVSHMCLKLLTSSNAIVSLDLCPELYNEICNGQN